MRHPLHASLSGVSIGVYFVDAKLLDELAVNEPVLGWILAVEARHLSSYSARFQHNTDRPAWQSSAGTEHCRYGKRAVVI